ncbi:MAG: 2-oxoglutarate dehydrogenase complex dihydrolipoyllysine-residue succinyltransferase, partial [Myxococcota bacterium]|nr:2-oxoglutarate dehydrogenase complex dihydrolipoyllysine-residue succinyltransferase [Myxococcota bacterium]
ESITEVIVSRWLVPVGTWVAADTPVVSLDTDKASVEVPAPMDGILKEILKEADETAGIGEVLGTMEGAERPADADPPAAEAAPAEEPAPAAPPAEQPADQSASDVVMPAAERLLAQSGLDASSVTGTGPGGRILKEDVQRAQAEGAKAPSTPPAPAAKAPSPPPPAPAPTSGGSREEDVVPMTRLRQVIAKRLVEAQQGAALLTTFNEVDMSAVMALRSEHKKAFIDRYGIKLGFMSFFIKATIEALKAYPALNSEIRGTDVCYRNYFDIGVAVGGGKGLVVPIIRNAESLSFAQIELTIADFGRRAKEGSLKLDELQGGTFSITNGGVYGSLLSTPILNPPQSGILGMHNIVERPIGLNGEVVLRPMMYLAVTYDHRIVDGREAVSFLKRIKECVESPERILLEV